MKIIEWTTSKITDLVQLPPEVKKWLTLVTDHPLYKIITGNYDALDYTIVGLVRWILKFLRDVITEIILMLFRPMIVQVQNLIDTINSYTKHPRSTTLSFAFWSDLTPDALKSDTLKDMVPDMLKDVVEDVKKAMDEIDKGIDEAGEEFEKMIEEIVNEVTLDEEEEKKQAEAKAKKEEEEKKKEEEEKKGKIEIEIDSPLARIEKLLEKIYKLFKLKKNNDGSDKDDSETSDSTSETSDSTSSATSK